MAEITEHEIRSQAWKFYLALFAWPLYLFLLPWATSRFGAYALLLMVFPGTFLFTWVGFCMHECWHQYVPGLPHRLLYTLYSWMLLSDPQIYRLLHGHHHLEVNTFADAEFHPLGEINGRFFRCLYHFFEIFLGVAFIVTLSSLTMPRHPRYRDKYQLGSLLVSLLMWIVLLVGLGSLAMAVFKVSGAQVATAYLATLWLSSLLLHHSQLVEHGNLIVAGDWSQRNLKTRNLRRQNWLEKFFLFLTHGDAREHVLHHTAVKVFSRPFPGRLPLPPEMVTIGLGEYLGILRDMLLGRPSSR
jgi:fatty acid desaturase